jgi:hypothetical protein
MARIEEQLKQHQDMLNQMSQQGTGASQPQIEAAHDSTGLASQRKSSVASTELPGDDDEPTIRYPVDDITVATPCELHVKVVNITMKVAVGYAIPIGPNPTYHLTPIPHGYVVVGVDQVMSGFEHLKLDYPAGVGDLYELGEAKKTTILWLKEYIVLTNWTPRSPACNPSVSSRQPSPLPRQPSLARQPSPARQPSLPPSPTEAQSQKQKRTIATLSMSRN